MGADHKPVIFSGAQACKIIARDINCSIHFSNVLKSITALIDNSFTISDLRTNTDLFFTCSAFSL